MEDWNMIAADCVVISCCCQCLVLQIVVFILLELPYKLIRKTKQYVKRKLGKPKREGNVMERERNGYYTDVGHSGSFRIEELCMEEWWGCGSSMKEVEKVLEDMSRKGEFSFGTFWCGEDLEESFPMYLVKQLEHQDLQYKLVSYSIAY